jgi:hypothetical protein
MWIRISVVDQNPKDSVTFGRIRIRKKISIQIQIQKRKREKSMYFY